MLRPKEYSEAERRLAGLARKIAMQRAPCTTELGTPNQS